MVERPKHWCHDKQGENDDCDQVCEQDGRITSTFERSVGHPDRHKTVHRGECIPNGRILVLNVASPVSEP